MEGAPYSKSISILLGQLVYVERKVRHRCQNLGDKELRSHVLVRGANFVVLNHPQVSNNNMAASDIRG